MLGIYVFDKYIELYRKYSASDIKGMKISPDDLAYERDWLNFVKEHHRYIPIKIDFDKSEYQTLTENSFSKIRQAGEYFLIETIGDILITTPDKEENYISKTFQEFYPDNN